MTAVRSAPLVLTLACLVSGPAAVGGQDVDTEPCLTVPVTDHRLFVCSYGAHPSVAVLLDAGAREDSRAWTSVVDELATFTRVITYDRAGLGRSDPGPEPRTVTVMAEEMRQLVDVLAPGARLILVGHSAGGWRVRRFAELHPERVAGLLLLDSPHEDFEAFRMSTLSADERTERTHALRESRRAASPGVQAEYAGMEDVGRELSGRLPDVPTIVVSAERHQWAPADRAESHEEAWRRLLSDLADSQPRGRFMVAEGTGHGIQRDDPGLVIGLIRGLVEEAGR